MKNFTEVPKTIQHICSYILTIKANGGNYDVELYNQLVNTDYPFTENEIWFIADSLGYNENVFSAIICSKIISPQSIFYMLKFTKFNINLCFLVVNYYNNINITKKIIEAIKEKRPPNYRTFLNSVKQQIFFEQINKKNNKSESYYHA